MGGGQVKATMNWLHHARSPVTPTMVVVTQQHRHHAFPQQTMAEDHDYHDNNDTDDDDDQDEEAHTMEMTVSKYRQACATEVCFNPMPFPSPLTVACCSG